MNDPDLKEAIRLALIGGTIPSNLDEFEEVTLPPGFILDDGKIYQKKKDGDVLVCNQPFKVSASVRDQQKGRWGKLCSWPDPDDQQHFAIIPDSESHKESVHQHLKSNGLGIMPGQAKAFTEMLMLMECSARINITSDMGWDEFNLLFVTQNEIIVPDGLHEDELTAFVPDGSGRVSETSQSGELTEWIQEVATPSMQHPLMAFAIMAAFVSCILRFISIDVGGFNLYGTTSRGKTTYLQLFASVFGNGSDPNSGGTSSVHRWDSTVNGLESLASRANDIGLALDELGAKNASEIRYILYNLMSGRGKEVMNSLRQSVKAKSWRSIVLSTGEKSVRNVLEDNGDDVKGGQLVRLADIPIDGIEFSSSVDPAKHVQTLKVAASKSYGTALPAFVKKLVSLKDDDGRPMGVVEVTDCLTDQLEYWEELLTVDGLTPEQARVVRRFAAVATAGALAVDFGILPYSEEHIQYCVEVARDQWLKGMRESDPALEGLINVARFVVDHADQNVDYSDPRSGKSLILIHGDLFNAACSGVDQKTVITKLSELGLLHRQESKRAKSTFTINGKRARYYALKPAIRNHYINS